eukprot:gene14797-10584_t
MTHVDVIDLTSSSSASPDTAIVDAAARTSDAATPTVVVTVEEAPVDASVAVEVSPVAIEAIAALDEGKP